MRRVLAPLAALSLCFAATPAGAVEWRRGGITSYAGTPEDVARAYLDDQLDSIGQQGRVELVLRNTLVVAGRYHSVRFTQRHQGVPVIGASTAVLVAPDGTVAVAVFDVARDLSVSTTPALTTGAAKSAVVARRGRDTPSHAELSIVRDGGGTLVWVVDVPSSDGGWRYLVDAENGRVLHERAMATHALGRVYGISSAVTPTPTDEELTDLTASTPQYLSGWGENLRVTNYVSGAPTGQGDPLVLEQTVVPSAGEDFLYDPPADVNDPTDAFAQVNLYYHLTRSRDFFRDVLAVDTSPTSWQLVAAANVQQSGQPLDNAFFTELGVGSPWNAPNFIGIGQGSFDFAYDSDVFIHEFGHYVSHNAVGYNEGQFGTTEWGLSPWSGSIDEGIADYFACSLNGDPTLGEASLTALGGERDLTDTSKVCPDDVIGEVHADGEMIGSMSWSIREALGAAVTDQLVWGAVSLLTTGTSLGDFARALRTTAEAMVGSSLTADDLTTIEEIIATRGFDECDQELPLQKDAPITTQMIGLDLLGQAFGIDCGLLQTYDVELTSFFHFRVTPVASDEAVRFNVDFGAAAGNLRWGIYVRSGEHVSMKPGSSPLPLPLPVPDVYDYSLEDITGPSGEIVIDEFSDPPFDPNTTYHMVIGHQNCPNVTAIVSTNTTGEPPIGGGGAGGEGGGGAGGAGGAPNEAAPVVVDDGCGCEMVGADPEPSSPWWAAPLLGLAAIRRRRRR